MALAATVMMFASTLVMAGESWEVVKKSQEITVFSRPLPGFSVNQFRGECLIPAPLDVLERIMRDFENYRDWFAMSRKVKVVREINADETILYYVIASPWPVADRDVTVRLTMNFDHTRGRGEVLLKSIDLGYAPEKSSYVRIRDMEGYFVFNRLEPSLTRVSLTMKVDPLIDLSRSVIDGILTGYPFNTLKNLKSRASAERK
jgi:hypothetical protein